MKRYHFKFIKSENPYYTERNHIIFAETLTDAIEKFERKNSLVAPAYLSLPSYETYMEIEFIDQVGYVWYIVSW